VDVTSETDVGGDCRVRADDGPLSEFDRAATHDGGRVHECVRDATPGPEPLIDGSAGSTRANPDRVSNVQRQALERGGGTQVIDAQLREERSIGGTVVEHADYLERRGRAVDVPDELKDFATEATAPNYDQTLHHDSTMSVISQNNACLCACPGLPDTVARDYLDTVFPAVSFVSTAGLGDHSHTGPKARAATPARLCMLPSSSQMHLGGPAGQGDFDAHNSRPPQAQPTGVSKVLTSGGLELLAARSHDNGSTTHQ
jgi:hypothetical protein